MQQYDFFAALIVGLLGAGHCFGMCGGVVGAFSQALAPAHRLSLQHRITYTLSYNLGRISSYVIAGAVVGLSSSALVTISSTDHVISVLQALAGIMLVLMGLYVAQWLKWLAFVEQLGKPLWQALTPVRQALNVIDSPSKAYAAGMVWGWLPCGLVYSTLTWALASGSAISGAQIMLGFGLGTLPALITMGAASTLIYNLLRKKKLRIISGLVLIAYGAQMAYIALNQFV
ncbi:sulfite exporter TauE/SafE family protein [Ferrimonas lipolytica]|uniref:Sulfite exporter TauE/SafE family protein n=1 Tax=Ferrimonas lipolytica TaxID=2724191 RepID=A0A6H1UCM0_9GAMM|nr:sulfite exporter TauE/SafE family protein [Ferrimonas lipolytica]QIZ76588.1 sulfite exporter TauE/SafE family protein [Ferrimonas lipolytica]